MNEIESMSLEQESQESDIPLSHFEQETGQEKQSQETQATESHTAKEPSASKKEHYSSQFTAFKKLFDDTQEADSKLHQAIDFMESSLTQGGSPHFRSFWEARRLCLPLFKENISPALRSHLWTKYSELSKEARRLKEILDEQSSFAVEQIEIAIDALEKDLTQFEAQAKTALSEQFPLPQFMSQQADSYNQLQQQLNILNTHAARINALRKELLKTDMRISHKNKFFHRLSSAGDQVFPKRKELIKQISQQFSQDVDNFIKRHFGSQGSREALYSLREEIKALQGLAKVLTLNTQSFTETRTRLSQCWDEIKAEEKERKKERAQQRIVQQQNFEEIEKQILALKEELEKNVEPLPEAQKKVDGIVAQMRKVDLGKDEVKKLKETLQTVRGLVADKLKSGEEARKLEAEAKELKKKEKYRQLKEQVEQLINSHETLDANQLTETRDQLSSQIQDSFLSKMEKQELERLLKSLRDVIADKKEKALMALSDDDRQALQQLKNILQQRKDRRQEIKDQLELLRKAAGSSALDFEKAMSCKEQINEEKERLEKANQSIQEIEKKIIELQGKIRGH